MSSANCGKISRNKSMSFLGLVTCFIFTANSVVITWISVKIVDSEKLTTTGLNKSQLKKFWTLLFNVKLRKLSIDERKQNSIIFS